MGYSIVLEGFAYLEKPWRKLLEACATNHIFLIPQWQRAWWQAFGKKGDLLLLSVKRDTELIGIAPLMRHGENISFIGSGDVCDYMDFIARRDEEYHVFSQLLDYLEPMNWNVIDLGSLLPNSLALRYFTSMAKQRNYTVKVTREDVSPQIFLPPSWEKYLSQLERKDRHELRRKLRRLERAELAGFHTIVKPEQLRQALEVFFELFKMSGDVKAGFMSDQRMGFFEAMVHSLAEEGYIRLSFLELGGIPVASALCFDYENELYLYNSGYNPDYAYFSVGLMVKVFSIKEGISEGKKRFDFLRGAEAYKYNLGGQDVPLYRCLISRG